MIGNASPNRSKIPAVDRRRFHSVLIEWARGEYDILWISSERPDTLILVWPPREMVFTLTPEGIRMSKSRKKKGKWVKLDKKARLRTLRWLLQGVL